MPENVFRLIVLTLLLAAGLVRARYSLAGAVRRAARPPAARQRDVYLFTLASLVPVLVYALSDALDFAHLDVPAPARLAGLVPGLAGLGLFVWSHRALGHNFFGTLDLADRHVLVTYGPYRHVRHPMYAAMFLSAAGYALVSANAVVALVHPPALAWMARRRMAPEEAMLAARFGTAYAAWAARTGRVWPIRRAPGRPHRR